MLASTAATAPCPPLPLSAAAVPHPGCHPVHTSNPTRASPVVLRRPASPPLRYARFLCSPAAAAASLALGFLSVGRGRGVQPDGAGSLACVGGVARSTSTSQSYAVVSDHQIRNATVEQFLWEIRNEKPFRFTPRQVAGFARNYSTRLGTGGFGTVFRGALPNGLPVAVKVFGAGLGARSEQEPFMAEVGTIGRTHHINLVRLFSFCFDDDGFCWR